MIEKPNIRDEKIIGSLDKNYSFQVKDLEFLPIGNDASAFSYRVEATNGNSYFLKIKRRFSNLAALIVPRSLKDNGLEQMVAPLPTKTQGLSVEIDDFVIILYPFIAGTEAMTLGMSDAQWIEFGSVLKQVHLTELPSDVSHYVSRENFVPKWSGTARELQKVIDLQRFDDDDQRELADFWKEKKEIIQAIIERTEMLGRHLQKTNLEWVLCHADIHTANILITPRQEMFLVDWDDTLFAPKERDLMFILGEDTIATEQEKLFFDGYGSVKINQLALAYYRYEWCVQEIGDFGERVFWANDSGEATRRASVEGFIKLFSEGDVIEGALRTSVVI